MKPRIKELSFLDAYGTGFNVRFYPDSMLEIAYFNEWRCIDYIFISLEEWQAQYK